jgi:hypothetical protein
MLGSMFSRWSVTDDAANAFTQFDRVRKALDQGDVSTSPGEEQAGGQASAACHLRLLAHGSNALSTAAGVGLLVPPPDDLLTH